MRDSNQRFYYSLRNRMYKLQGLLFLPSSYFLNSSFKVLSILSIGSNRNSFLAGGGC